MSLSDPSHGLAFDPLRLSARPLAVKAAFVLAGTLVLALASQIAVPMVPVPITMQTFAVTMIGALYGWRLGALTVLGTMSPLISGLRGLFGSKIDVEQFTQAQADESSTEAVEALPSFRQVFGEMLDAKTDEGEAVYVFIDDLDRAQPDVALDILVDHRHRDRNAEADLSRAGGLVDGRACAGTRWPCPGRSRRR